MDQQGIIARLKNGDREVFNEIVESCQEMVFNTALSIVKQEEDAEDITQEVFVTLYEKLDDFREESQLSTWLYRVTIHKALDLDRKKKRARNGGLLRRIFMIGEQDEPVHFNHPGILMDQKENAAALFKALDRLPEKQRIVFMLQKMEGLGNKEIADIMNTSLTAVESLQLRAKKKLKEILQKTYDNIDHS